MKLEIIDDMKWLYTKNKRAFRFLAGWILFNIVIRFF